MIILGSAVSISCEIESNKISGTTITLESLKDIDGVEWASSEALTFGTGDEATIATVVWQSTTSNLPGKYTFILKALNGTRENFTKGSFYLEEQDES